MLSKVSDWLKPGGVFYTLVPNIDSGEARFFESCWYGLELPRHLSHFCPDSLRRLAESAGLTKISLETNRNSALDYSLRYVNTEILSRFGISRDRSLRPATRHSFGKPSGWDYDGRSINYSTVRPLLPVRVRVFTHSFKRQQSLEIFRSIS